MAQCVVEGFGGGCSPGSAHTFLLLAIVMHRQLQSPFVALLLYVCPLRLIGRAAQESCLVTLKQSFCSPFPFVPFSLNPEAVRGLGSLGKLEELPVQ